MTDPTGAAMLGIMLTIIVILGLFVIFVCVGLVFGFVTIEERYGATPWPEKRLRAVNCFTIWTWND